MASVGQALVKRLGQFIAGRNPTPRPRPFAEMGTSGTAVWGGYVQVKERSPQWIGRQKYITSSDLAVNTSIVAAGVHYFLNLVAYPKWTFRATDEDDEESLALAEFADNVFNDMDTPWYKVVRRAAMYRFHGFGLQEWTAKHRDDGLIGFKDVEARPQHTIEQWDVDVNGAVLGVWQRSPQTGNMLGIPRDKLLYLVEDTLTDSPEGLGLFRHMADPYQRLKQLQDLEIRAYERDLRGTPIARAPLTMLDRAVSQNVISQEEADRMVADFEQLVKLQVKQSDTGIVMDSLPYFSDSDAGDVVSGLPQWNFELLSGGGVGHSEVAAAIDRIQREIARLIGVEQLMMGGDIGSRSLSEDKSRTLYLVSNSVLKYIATRVKSDLLVPLWKLNGFPMKKMPQPKPEDVTFKNVDAITAAIQKMAAAGSPLSPNDPVINDVRDLLGISRVPDDVMAQGATPPSNPALAGLPPQLQFGGRGQQPIQLQLGSGGPGKQPGMGGGAMPGMGGIDPTNLTRKRDGDELEDEDERRKPVRGINGKPPDGDIEARIARANQQRQVGMDPNDYFDQHGQKEETVNSILANGKGKPSATGVRDGLGTPGDINEDERPIEDPANPGHFDAGHEREKVKQTVDEPSQVFQEVLGSRSLPASSKPGPTEAGDKPADKPSAGMPLLRGIQVEQKGNGKVEIDSALLVRLLDRLSEKPGAQLEPKGDIDKPAESLDKPQEGKGKAEPAIPADKPEDKTNGEAKEVAALGAGLKQPPGAKQAPAIEGAVPQVQPGGKKPGGEAVEAPVTSGAKDKPPVDPKTGKPVEPGQMPVDSKGKPVDPVDPKTGQPRPIDPATGQPTPDGKPQEEPEMTAERASEVLQPYADTSGKGPEEEEPRTEYDLLWSRLGEEKDVQPNTSDNIDPITGAPISPISSDLSLQVEDGTELRDTPPELAADEDDGGTEEEAAVRARLLDRLGTGDIENSEAEELPKEDEQLIRERIARERLTPKKLKPRTPRVRL